MLNLDTRIPLMAQERDYGRGFDMMQQAQMNQLKLQALRDEYNAAKEERDRQKAMRQGMASELQKMQQGTPAQYRTTFPQTMPTGLMPSGMTGVLASERGQSLPQPALFGENILQGNFDINRELVSPAIAPKQPDIKDILTAQFNAAVANNDVATAFDAKKNLKELEKSPIKWGMNPQKGINPATGLPDTFVTNESGELKFLNVSPYEEPKTPKKSLIQTTLGYEVVEEGELPKGKPVVATKEPKAPQLKKITGRDGSVNILNMETGEIKPVLAEGKPFIEEDDPLTLFTQKENFKSELKQRETVAQKYADASDVIPLLDGYIADLEKTPANFASSLYYKTKGLASTDNPELQAVYSANQKAKTLINYAQKQPGPSTDYDVRNYLEQVGIASDITVPRDARIAAAKSAKAYAVSIQKKYGKYASDILSGKVTPDELKTEPSKPTRSKEELFQLKKEYEFNRKKYKDDPEALKILDDKARELGLIK